MFFIFKYCSDTWFAYSLKRIGHSSSFMHKLGQFSSWKNGTPDLGILEVSRLRSHKCQVAQVSSHTNSPSPMFVERKVLYSALFTNLVVWHTSAVSFSLSDIILAHQACPLSDVMFLYTFRNNNLSLYKHCPPPIYVCCVWSLRLLWWVPLSQRDMTRASTLCFFI
jgi:hypothetical protein